MAEQKLTKSSTDKKLCGVCGGLAKHMGLDVTILRVLWAVFTLLSVGCGILLYLICALILPNDTNA